MTYLNNWNSKEDMIRNFQISEKEVENINVIVASYEDGNYEGRAFVLFEEDGKLFEINAYHCSCYGLEGSWKPEEVELEALKFRVERGQWDSRVLSALKEFLEGK